MSERFEDRLWVALESTVPSIRQERTPTRRRAQPNRRRSLAIAAAVVVVAAGAASVFAWQRDTVDIEVSPAGRGDGDRVGEYLTFPASLSPRRDRQPQMSSEELARADASEQRFVERSGDRNRASLAVGVTVQAPAAAADLVTPGGVPVDVTVRAAGDPALPLQMTWELDGHRWFVQNGEPAQGQRLLSDGELLDFIDSLRVEGARLVSTDHRYVESPRTERRQLWAVATPSGESLTAERWGTPDLSDIPGTTVRVRGTDGVLTRGVWSEAVGGDPTAVLRWREGDAVMSLTVPGTGRIPLAVSKIVGTADALVRVSKTEFESMPFDPGVGWGSDGELVVRVPPLESWAHESLSINTVQRTRSGATVHGSRIGLGLSRLSQSWLPDTVAVRAASDAAEILVWIGDEPEPPACARAVPVRSGQSPEVIDLDPTCTG